MNDIKSTNITWSEAEVTKEDHEKLLNQRGCVVWFTGLSGSGKSTIATNLEKRLFSMGLKTYVLDGDNVRHGLNSDLGFSEDDRRENIRRVGEVSALFADAGIILLSAFISPFTSDRDKVRSVVPDGRFFEVYLNPPIDICEQRDPKGLYKKVRAGEIEEFTGISSPYEAPENPELSLDTSILSIDQCVDSIIELLKENIIK